MSENRSTTSRRRFVTGLTAAGLGAPYFVPQSVLGQAGRPGANDRIQVALIGAGGMGRANLANCAKYPDVVVTGVSDVWQARREQTVAQYQPTAKGYVDYREMLQQPDVDAVIIATPPHWHALQAIHAVEAGKDIYLQKPMSLHVAESLAVKRAVKKHGAVSQIGTQIHAGENYRRVVEWVRSGRLGPISVARTFFVINQGPEGIGHAPETDPPAGFDWDRWVGPNPMRPFNALLIQNGSNRCSFSEFGDWTPGMAPHILDLPCWALELDFPTAACSSGGRFTVQGDGDGPDTQEVLWQYPNMTMTWMMSIVNSYGFDLQGENGVRRRLGVYLHGTDGTLYSDYARHTVVPEGDRLKDPSPPEPSIPPSPGHEREWLDCVRSRQQPSCSAAYHSKIDVAISLATLSLRLGRSIRFDPATEEIIGDQEAQRAAKPVYRDPWKFPEEYV